MANVVAFVQEQCRTASYVRRAWLFGSQSTGCAEPLSDYDFAFDVISNLADPMWGIFCEHLRENNPTLNSLDLIRLDWVSAEVRQRILSEGQVIYEQEKIK